MKMKRQMKNSAHKGLIAWKKMEKFVQEAIFAKGLDEIAGFSGKNLGRLWEYLRQSYFQKMRKIE